MGERNWNLSALEIGNWWFLGRSSKKMRGVSCFFDVTFFFGRIVFAVFFFGCENSFTGPAFAHQLHHTVRVLWFLFSSRANEERNGELCALKFAN